MDDWKVGDLALCVNDAPPKFPGVTQARLRRGAIYEVEDIWIGGEIAPNGNLNCWPNGEPSLRFAFDRGTAGAWVASRFRKIAPHEPDSEDAETIYQLVYAPSPAFREPVQ